MTLPVSGSISINDILVELGRASGELIITNDAELYQLAGKTAGEALIFPSDFYGKSLAQDFTTSITLEYVDFNDYRYSIITSKGSAIPQKLNGVGVISFSEGAFSIPAAIRLSGRCALNGLKKLEIDSDGGSNIVIVDPAEYGSIFLTFGIYGWVKHNSAATFSVKLTFNESYLLASGFDPASSGSFTGFETGSYGNFDSVADNMNFSVGGSAYSVHGIYQNSNTSEITLEVEMGASPALTASAFAKLRLAYYSDASTKNETLLLTSDASFSIFGDRALWSWSPRSPLATTTYLSSGYGFALIL